VVKLGHHKCVDKVQLIYLYVILHTAMSAYSMKVAFICFVSHISLRQVLTTDRSTHESVLVFAAARWWGVPLSYKDNDEGSTNWWKALVASGLWVITCVLSSDGLTVIAPRTTLVAHW